MALAATSAFLSVCVSLGFGKHNADIPGENFTHLLLFSYCAGFASILAALWSKISFGITLLRISKRKRHRSLLWFMVVSVSLVLGASATIHWVQCWPIDRLWRSDVEGQCLPRRLLINYNVFAAGMKGFLVGSKRKGLRPWTNAVIAYSGAADISLALFPWFIIWADTIGRKEKLGVVISMSMGVL